MQNTAAFANHPNRSVVATPPGRGVGLVADARPLVASLLAVIAGSMAQFLTASVAGEIDGSFRFSPTMLGCAVALFNLVGVVLAPLMTTVIRRLGVRATLRASAVIAGLSALGVALLASSAWELLGLLMIGGISNGAAGPAASLLVRKTVAGHRHGLAFGTQQAGAPAGLFLAGLAVPLVAVPFGWRWAFVGLAGIAVLAALVVPAVPEGEAADTPAAAARTTPHMSRGVLALIVIGATGASAVGVGAVSFLVSFATSAGMSGSAAGLLLGAVSLLAMVGRTGFGLAVDRGHADALKVAVPLFGACTVAVALFVLGGDVAIVLGALVMGGLGWAWGGVLMLAAVREAPDAPVWAAGVLLSGVFSGAILGPVMIGALASASSFRMAWAACAVLSVLPLVALGIAVRSRSRDKAFWAGGTRPMNGGSEPRIAIRVRGERRRLSAEPTPPTHSPVS